MIRWRLDPGQIEVVDDAVAEVLRRKTPAERVAMIAGSQRTARLILKSAIRRRHSDWSDVQLDREVAARLLNGTTRAG